MSEGRSSRRREALFRAFLITSPAHETKVIFAGGTWSAVGMLLRWRTENEIGEAPFTIDPTWASRLTGTARKHLDDACGWCTEASVGVQYCAGAGWGLAGAINERDDPD